MTEWNPDWVMRPGVHLQEWMEEHEVSPAEAATLSGLSLSTIQGVLDGTVAINEEVAAGLEKSTGIGIRAPMWLNLERMYRDGLAVGKSDIS